MEIDWTDMEGVSWGTNHFMEPHDLISNVHMDHWAIIQ